MHHAVTYSEHEYALH